MAGHTFECLVVIMNVAKNMQGTSYFPPLCYMQIVSPACRFSLFPFKKKRSDLFYPETGKFKLLCPEGFLVLENFAQNRAETPDSFREILHKCLLTKTNFAFIINLL